MTLYYELFFDGEDINDFWGTAETVFEDGAYELCAQPYYVRLDDEMLDNLSNVFGIDPSFGPSDNEEMRCVLETYHSPVSGDADVDLVNCVYPETQECLYAFREIDEGEYDLAVE